MLKLLLASGVISELLLVSLFLFLNFYINRFFFALKLFVFKKVFISANICVIISNNYNNIEGPKNGWLIIMDISLNLIINISINITVNISRIKILLQNQLFKILKLNNLIKKYRVHNWANTKFTFVCTKKKLMTDWVYIYGYCSVVQSRDEESFFIRHL